MLRYIPDTQLAKRNISVYEDGAGTPSFEAVLSVKFSNEDATEPITLQQVKEWCNIDGNDSDAILTMLIKAARKRVENLKRTSFINRTIEAVITPGTNLPYGPVKNITSIKSVADSGATFTRLEDVTENVAVTYTAGPGDHLSEENIVMIWQQLAFMLENRGDEKVGSGPISPIIAGNLSRLPLARIK